MLILLEIGSSTTSGGGSGGHLLLLHLFLLLLHLRLLFHLGDHLCIHLLSLLVARLPLRLRHVQVVLAGLSTIGSLLGDNLDSTVVHGAEDDLVSVDRATSRMRWPPIETHLLSLIQIL